jgi:hypothetical protein
MKKQFLSIMLIAVLLLTFLSTANSQGLFVGGKIGMGLSTLSNWDNRSSGSDTKKRSPLTGLLATITGKYMFNDLLGLQAELQYVQKGETEKSVSKDGTTFKDKKKTNYLVLPVLLNVSHSFENILVYGNIGPYFGLGLNAQSIMVEPDKGGGNLKFKKGGLQRFDMGLCIGAGAGYRLGPGDIILDIRYDLGFMDTYSTPDEIKGNNYKATKNRTLGISVGYVIPLGQE